MVGRERLGICPLCHHAYIDLKLHKLRDCQGKNLMQFNNPNGRNGKEGKKSIPLPSFEKDDNGDNGQETEDTGDIQEDIDYLNKCVDDLYMITGSKKPLKNIRLALFNRSHTQEVLDELSPILAAIRNKLDSEILPSD